jgi:hypothetical protein
VVTTAGKEREKERAAEYLYSNIQGAFIWTSPIHQKLHNCNRNHKPIVQFSVYIRM